MGGRDFSFQVDGTTGKGVLLVHGLTGAPGEMKFLANRLNKRGFGIRAPQLAGHGADEATLLKTRWPDWLDSIRSALDRFSSEVDEIYVAGICVGGALGLALAAEDRRVRACAVYSMTYRYDGWNMKRWYSGVVPLVRPFARLPGFRQMSFAEPHPFGLKDERLRERVNDAAKPMIPGALSRLPLGCMYEMHALAEHIDRIGRTITQPTLILHAAEDDMSDPRNAERLRRALGGPVDLRLLHDSYHMIHVDRERGLVADLTASFFGAPASAPRETEQMANA